MSIFDHIFDEIDEIDSVEDQATGEKTENYFPYPTYRDGQQKIIDEIGKLEDGQSIVIQAGTGSGKTIATLSALLAKKKSDDKIIIFVKTINQINPILREWQQIARYRKRIQDNNPGKNPIEGMTILPLLGRQRLCNLEFVTGNATIINCRDTHYKQLPYWKKKRLRGKLRRSNHRYRLLNWLNWKLMDTSISVETFKQILRSRENCPYENIITSLPDSDIIVTTYAYLKTSLFQRLMRLAEIHPERTLIYIDEAHNLAFRRPIELYKQSLTHFMSVFGTSHLLENLIVLMRGVRYVDNKKILDDNKEEIRQLQKLLRRIQQLGNTKESQKIKEITEEILNFIQNLNDQKIIATSEKLVIPVVQPGKLLESITGTRIRVFQSATITPVKAFVKLFELPSDTEIVDLVEYDNRKIWKRENEFRAFYRSSINSLARFRKAELFKRFARIIVELAAICPNHTMVLTPSYEYSERLNSQINTMYPKLKRIVEKATTSTKQLHGLILNTEEKSLIIGNQRGKILEGNEWIRDGKSVVSLVIFSGLSTQVPIEEEKLMIDLRNEILEDWDLSKKFQIIIPTIIRAKQSLGRTIRGKMDRGGLIILDNRIDKYLQRNLALQRYWKLEELKSGLNGFMKNNKFPFLTFY